MTVLLNSVSYVSKSAIFGVFDKDPTIFSAKWPWKVAIQNFGSQPSSSLSWGSFATDKSWEKDSDFAFESQLIKPQTSLFSWLNLHPSFSTRTTTMSWQSYVDDQLLNTRMVTHAVICGHDGNIWASSNNFSVRHLIILIKSILNLALEDAYILQFALLVNFTVENVEIFSLEIFCKRGFPVF